MRCGVGGGRKEIMTVGEFKRVLNKNNIPDDVTMLSDSGWECSATDMDGIYYNAEEKEIVFTQEGDEYDRSYYAKDGWRLIHWREEC